MPKSLPPAEFLDLFIRRSALGVFLLALAYGLAALASVLGDEWAAGLGYVQLGLSFAILVVVFPVFWRYLRLRGTRAAGCPSPESYLASQFQKASAWGFTAMFIVLVLMEALVRKLFPETPAERVLNLALALGLTVFSLAFFFLSRADLGDEEADEEDEA